MSSRLFPATFFRSRRTDFLLSLLMLAAVIVCSTPRTFSQVPPAPKSALNSSAMDNLPDRVKAVQDAQQGGDVARIATANRNLIAVVLCAMAELKLAPGPRPEHRPLQTFFGI